MGAVAMVVGVAFVAARQATRNSNVKVSVDHVPEPYEDVGERTPLVDKVTV